MRLTAKAVGDVLEATLGYRVEMTPHGFDLVTDDLAPRRARLRSGGGIAGNSDVWWLVHLPAGEVIVGQIRTVALLRRSVLEFMAGPRPADLSDYTKPVAKRVMLRNGASRFVWSRRQKAKRLIPMRKFLAAQEDRLFTPMRKKR